MNKHELIAYAMDFCSFLLRSEIVGDIDRIILFGSVARGDFDNESDIDIFIDTERRKKVDETAKKVLKSFEMSEVNEKWRLKGLKNALSLKIGEIEKWELYRSVISSGILLYGRFEEMPKGAKYYSLFVLNFSKMDRNKKIKIWRELYGYKQKIGEKLFVSKGLLEEVLGKKIKRSVIVVPAENKKKILDFIKRKKIKYSIFEIWTDSF
ncbi:MAG: nucleotidyltransferase domain-containing protein [Candidatus Methanoperedens sp.]|nr:nucleotidyltransferase domain-containing protein [Candidatus Methanoperedens sp.]